MLGPPRRRLPMREMTGSVVKWMISEKRLYCGRPRVESEPEETPKGRVRVAEARENELLKL